MSVTTDQRLLDLGVRIGTLRNLRGMTQAQLGAAAGISRASVANTETGRQGDIPATKLVALAEALGVQVGMLLGEIPMPEVPIVRVVTRSDVVCDDCGQVRAGFLTQAEAEEARHKHIQGHTR